MVNARLLPRWIVMLVALLVVVGMVGQSLPVAAQTPKPAATPAELQTLPFDVPANPPVGVTTLSPDTPLAAPIIVPELESNNTVATANPLSGTQQWVRGTIGTAGDRDYYRFSAQAGDRVYLSLHTNSIVVGSDDDTYLTLYSTNGTTILEDDDDNGTFSQVSSVIAGRALPTTGTYYVLVEQFDNTEIVDRYDLYFRLHSGSPASETEPNNTPAAANTLGANGWVAGTLPTTTDVDVYAYSLNAGDSVILMADWDPSRSGGTGYNGQLLFGLYPNQGTTGLVFADDNNLARPNAEAFFIRVRNSGTYYVGAQRPAAGTAPYSYHLSVSVFPAQAQTCTTYTSTNVPVVIGPNVGTVASTLTVSGQGSSVADINVTMNLTHTYMQDVDATLVAPGGTSVPLFSDVGAASEGIVDTLNFTLDNEAPLAFNLAADAVNMVFQPESPGRLTTFNGINPNGTWTLNLADDDVGDGGRLLSWAIELCSAPLAVTLASFEATPRESDIQVTWESAQETDLLGYNLLRGDAPDGEVTRLNDELILSQSPGGGQGAAYEWIDDEVTAGSTYFYTLEAVNLDGSSQRFGPVSATFNAPTAVTLAQFESPLHGEALSLLLVAGVIGLAGVGVVLRRR